MESSPHFHVREASISISGSRWGIALVTIEQRCDAMMLRRWPVLARVVGVGESRSRPFIGYSKFRDTEWLRHQSHDRSVYMKGIRPWHVISAPIFDKLPNLGQVKQVVGKLVANEAGVLGS